MIHGDGVIGLWDDGMIGWKWLEMVRMAGNDKKLLEWLEMAGNGCKWPELLDMPRNGLT